MKTDTKIPDKLKEQVRVLVYENSDWQNPYLLDEIKEEFQKVDESLIDNLYEQTLKARIKLLGAKEKKAILEIQESLTSANQNFLLQELLEQEI